MRVCEGHMAKTQPYQKADECLKDLGCALCHLPLQRTKNSPKIVTVLCWRR